MTAAKPTAPLVSVYSGSTCIGFVLGRGVSGFEAFDADQRSLGTYPSEREAVAAVLARGQV
jgi:hypothetical protein